MTKEEIKKAMSLLAKYRWENTPMKARREYSKKLHRAKAAKKASRQAKNKA